MVRVPGPGLCTPPSACWGPTASHYQGSSGLTGKDFRRPVTLVSTGKRMDGGSSGAEYETLSWGACTPAQWLLTVLGNWLQGKLHGRRVNRSRPHCTCVRVAGASGRQSSTWASIGKNLGYRPGHLPRQPSQPSSSLVPCSAPRSGAGCP